jgi:hypothetical protein
MAKITLDFCVLDAEEIKTWFNKLFALKERRQDIMIDPTIVAHSEIVEFMKNEYSWERRNKYYHFEENNFKGNALFSFDFTVHGYKRHRFFGKYCQNLCVRTIFHSDNTAQLIFECYDSNKIAALLKGDLDMNKIKAMLLERKDQDLFSILEFIDNFTCKTGLENYALMSWWEAYCLLKRIAKGDFHNHLSFPVGPPK